MIGDKYEVITYDLSLITYSGIFSSNSGFIVVEIAALQAGVAAANSTLSAKTVRRQNIQAADSNFAHANKHNGGRETKNSQVRINIRAGSIERNSAAATTWHTPPPFARLLPVRPGFALALFGQIGASPPVPPSRHGPPTTQFQFLRRRQTQTLVIFSIFPFRSEACLFILFEVGIRHRSPRLCGQRGRSRKNKTHQNCDSKSHIFFSR